MLKTGAWTACLCFLGCSTAPPPAPAPPPPLAKVQPTTAHVDSEPPDLPAGWTPGASPRPLPPPDADALEREAIRQGFREHVNSVGRCAWPFLCHNAVVTRFRVAADGIPRDVTVRRRWGAAPPAELAPCLQRAVRAVRIAWPRGFRGARRVSYPLHYRCAGDD